MTIYIVSGCATSIFKTLKQFTANTVKQTSRILCTLTN